MKTKPANPNRTEIKARAEVLVEDLNAVRTMVLNKQREISPEDYLSLERRLFESWVIEKLAEAQDQFALSTEQGDELREELGELGKELKGLQKLVAKLEKKVHK